MTSSGLLVAFHLVPRLHAVVRDGLALRCRTLSRISWQFEPHSPSCNADETGWANERGSETVILFFKSASIRQIRDLPRCPNGCGAELTCTSPCIANITAWAGKPFSTRMTRI